MKVGDQKLADSAAESESAWARVRQRSFGPASLEPFRRRVSDWIRLVSGIVLLIVLLDHQSHESQIEVDFYDVIHDLPRSFLHVVRLFYALGAFWAVGLVIVAAVVSERHRLARDLFIGGALSWALARLIAALVEGASFGRGLDV